MTSMRRCRSRTLVCSVLLSVAACSGNTGTIPEGRYIEPDKLYRSLEDNVRADPRFEVIVDIDHSRLAAKAGSSMPPSHVLIWSDPELDAAILKHKPLAAIDRPLRVLAFEDPATGKAAIIANSYDYVAQRHSLPRGEGIRARYGAAIAAAMKGMPGDAIARFPSDAMKDAGLVTRNSTHDLTTTEKRILDAFCQKLLIWQDAGGAVHVTFNDLLALAERQQVSGGVTLRVIRRRLKETFSTALRQ